MSRRGVITAGTWCLDRNILVSTWPAENGRADILDDRRCGGGSSYNLAANMKALDPDIPVETIALAGDDEDGRFLLATAREHGIGTDAFELRAGVKTDFTLAFASRDTGRRTHMSAFDAAHALTPDDFDFTRTNARLAHIGLPGIHKVLDGPWRDDVNGWVTVLRKARAAGLATNMELVSVEAERIGALVRPCLPHLDLLVVNDHEIGGLTGVETVPGGRTDREACRAAAVRALEAGVAEAVAVHFPEGAVAVARSGEVVTMPSVNVPPDEILGANGAGDAFASGFVYGWHEGWPLAERVRLAHAVAAASLRDITTTGAIVSWRECLALADAWGWRAAPSTT